MHQIFAVGSGGTEFLFNLHTDQQAFTPNVLHLGLAILLKPAMKYSPSSCALCVKFSSCSTSRAASPTAEARIAAKGGTVITGCEDIHHVT